MIGLDRRVRIHARQAAIPVELAANDIVRRQRPDRLEEPDALRQEHVAVEAARRLHRHERQDLQEVVLHHVADRTHLVVERTALRTPNFSAIVICTLST